MPKGRIWTASEVEALCDMWGVQSIDTIARNMRRTPEAICLKAQRLKLGPHIMARDVVSVNTLYRCLYRANRDIYKINTWIEHGFPIRRHKVNKSRFLVVKIDEFWDWAKEHKQLVSFAMLEENIFGIEPAWVKEKRAIDRQCHTPTRRWTANDDEKLKYMLKQFKYNLSDIARELQRSEGAVKRRIFDLHIREWPIRGKQRLWKSEELNILITMREKGYSFEQIGIALNRTGASARARYEIEMRGSI